MKEKELKIQYQIAELSELSETEQELVKKAMDATNHAYANYSHFYVGAACLLADGKMVIGANQENAAFPSGLCAERSAIFGAQSYSCSMVRMASSASTASRTSSPSLSWMQI